MMCGAESRLLVRGIEPAINARRVIGRRNQTAKRLARLSFEIGGKRIAAPGLVQNLRGTRDVAPRQQRAGERKTSFGGARRIASKKSDHRLWVGALLPECRFGAAAQQRNARPARTAGDKGGIAREVTRTIFAA